MLITMLSAGLLGLLLLILSVRVTAIRRSQRISVGDGGNAVLEGRCRAQANLAEYLPVGLFLIFLAEQAFGPRWYVIALAALFVIARLLHPAGMSRPAPNLPRAIGAGGTYLALLLLSGLVLARGIMLLA